MRTREGRLYPSALIALASFAAVATDVRAAAASPPAAGQRPDPDSDSWPLALAIGGGVNASGRMTVEGTFLPDLPGPYVSLGYSNTADGGRVYAESGIYAVLSLAAGVGRHISPSGASPWSFHLFVGLPLPVAALGPGGVRSAFSTHIAPLIFYLEPFYRPVFREGSAVEHEAGLLLKVRVGLTKRQWSLPGHEIMPGIRDL